MLKRDPFSKQKIIFKKIWFFSLLLLSGTVLTIKLKRPEALLALKAASWISSDYPLIMFLIVKIMSWRWSYRGIQLIIRLRVGLSHLREHKFKPSFQDYEFQFPDAVLMWNQLLISFSTAPCTMMKEILTWALKNVDCRLLNLTETVLIKRLLLGNCSVFTYIQINRFFMFIVFLVYVGAFENSSIA